MYEISKEFEFEASHVLTKVPPDHKCGRLPSHGHSYKVVITLRAHTLNDMGFVIDFGDLDPIKKYIDNHFDHRFLNDMVDFETTAENLAHHFFGVTEKLLVNLGVVSEVWVHRVDVWETRKSKGSWINE